MGKYDRNQVYLRLGSALAAAAGVLVRFHSAASIRYGHLGGLRRFVRRLGALEIFRRGVGRLAVGITETMVVGICRTTYKDAVAFAILI